MAVRRGVHAGAAGRGQPWRGSHVTHYITHAGCAALLCPGVLKSERHGACALQGKIQEWAKGAGVTATDLADICKDPKTSDFLLKELNTTGREGKLKVGGARATAVQAVVIFWRLCCLWRLLPSTWFSCDPALQ